MTKDAALTPLGVMVLALLREGDMHPYEMIRLLRHRREDRMVKITNGTFYHTVARLEQQGLLAEAGVDRDGNRPERTTYTLTEAGQPAIEHWVREHLAGDGVQNFRVALAEAHNLPRAEVAALLSMRREALAVEYTVVEAGLHSAHERGVSDQYIVELDRHIALLRADIDWTDSLLARLEREDYPWGDEGLTPENIEARDAMRKAAQQ
ncbi:PadR family transcriptional regulator [Microbacterium sp. KR10-403]|uniref:PadR family transcriptional regulator n=1 Tax=Microbacterium sp. KR10-403 TaxID=3158581 RepID=UPI0032E40F07